jgi:NADPH:quinone reductase-like Zn-dependent oxidoreductase
MKAVICTGYGPPHVLVIGEAEKPAPGDHEVLVRIHATAVTASDCIVRGFKLPFWHPIGFMMGLFVGFSRPRNPVLGMVLAGEVEAIGADVTRFRPGDQVYAMTGTRFGCYAEYTCVPETGPSRFPWEVAPVMDLKPSVLSYAEAAAIPYGAGLGAHYLRAAAVQPGQRVLIYGASGAIGTTMVQLAGHHYGAHVTAVCSAANADLVRSLGAHEMLDYTTQDTVPPGTQFDVALDAVGRKKTSALKEACRAAVAPTGKWLSVDDGHPALQASDLVLLRELIEAGRFRAVIDRCYPLDEIVAAHQYVDAGHKKGNVVITVA